jgi:uncharacterized protein involved in outer membrane biogenesis
MALVALALSALLLVDTGAANGVLRSLVQSKTGRALNFRRLEFHLLRRDPTIIVDDLRVGSPPAIARDDLVRVGHGVIHIRLSSLLRAHVTLTGADLSDVDLRMVRLGHGRTNYSFGGKGLSAALHDVGPMTIRDAKVSYVDPERQITLQCRVEYDSALGARPMSMDGGGVNHGETYTIKAKGAPLTGRDPTTPFAFNADLVDGAMKMSLLGATQKPFDFREFDLAIRATGPDLADLGYLYGVAIPSTPRFVLAANAAHHNHVLSLRNIDGRFGESAVKGDFTSDHSRQRRVLTANVHAGLLRAQDLAVLFSAPRSHAAARSQPGVPAKPAPGAPHKPFDVAAFQRGDVFFDLWAARITGYAAPLSDVRLHVALKEGRLEAKPISANLSPGRFEGAFTATAGQGGLTVQADGSVHDAEPGRALKSKSLTGVFDGAAHLNGAGRSQEELLKRARGDLAFRLRGGALKRSQADALAGDLLKAAWAGLTDKSGVVALTCAQGRFALQDGVLTPTDLTIATPEGAASGHGAIDLTTRRIDLTLVADTSGGSRALFNAPVHLTGDLQHPKAGVDIVRAVGRTGKTILGTSAPAARGRGRSRASSACPAPF